MQRVLCYSPYNLWALHGLWEITILHGLRLRGADVRFVLCDGAYSDCDVFWAATSPRHELSCATCQAAVAGQAGALAMPFEWLGRYLTLEERREAREWERALARDDLLNATYEGWPVSDWVQSSVHTHIRTSVLELDRPEVEAALRSYLFSGLVACFGLSRLLDDFDPQTLLLFNGRLSSTRIAMELARRRGARVVTHERGWGHETLRLLENTNPISLDPPQRLWADWKDVPLTADELEDVDRYLADRELGRNLGMRAYSPPVQSVEAVASQLGLSLERPVWVVFTSSDDEIIASDDWRGPFARQLDWIERTVAWSVTQPQIDLVIRVHPNTGGKRSVGTNAGQLRQFEALRERLPENVRIVMPDDDVSTYTLMDIASVALVYQSTVAIELGCKGKRVVVASGNVVAGLPFVRTVTDEAAYEQILEGLLPTGPRASDPEITRGGLRFAHAYFIRACIPFPLVHMPDPHTGRPVYTSIEELRPGRDPALDRVVRILLDGEPVTPPPGRAEHARTTADEDAWLLPEPEGARGFAVLAFADELISDPALLRAFGERFSAADDATLVIEGPPHLNDALVAAVRDAGLDGEDAPDLLVVASPPAGLAAVLSHRAHALPLPTYGARELDALRALAA